MNPYSWKNRPFSTLTRICVLGAAVPCCVLVATLCWQRIAAVQGQAHAALWMRSASFSDGGAIPRQHTCDGADLSPELQWQPAPAGTKSFALVMDDPDAAGGFTHWLVYNIAPGERELPQGASTHAASHQGAAEGSNNFGRVGYGGPCPPRGKPHHYVFRVYAVNALLDLPPGATRQELDAAIAGHVVAEGQLTGVYQR
jgi:Raf kinase inhibitor-like YbhB/YbcL family protein